MDGWIVVYFGVGVVAAFLRFNFGFTLIIAVIYELIEPSFDKTIFFKNNLCGYVLEFWKNRFVDILAALLGYFVYYVVYEDGSVGAANPLKH